ncbi:MAG: hypothetical protein RJA70_4277 [Pseudomonadota bacterium]
MASEPRQQLLNFCGQHGARLEEFEGEPFGSRVRARLAIRGSAESPKIGIFEAGTHRVADIPRCHIHHPQINVVAAACKRAIRQTHLSPYSDKTKRGVLRYLQVVVQRASGKVQLVVVANLERPDGLVPFFRALKTELGQDLNGLFWNLQSEDNNRILGVAWGHVSGPEALHETLGGAKIFFPPDAFGQANLALFDRIVAQVHSWVNGEAPLASAPKRQSVVELYAGVGAIGLGLLASGHSLTFNELASGGIRGLRLGIRELALEAAPLVLEGDAAVAIPALESTDWVIVDPPRKGLSSEVLQALIRLASRERPLNIAYVSCGLPSFLRDAGALLEAGYRLRNCQAYALFPFTEHLETLAWFRSGA